MKALGSFQKFMKEGNPELGIPILDPVQMQSFNYSLVNEPVGFRMEILFEVPKISSFITIHTGPESHVKHNNN
jgi:hypothetical protein